MKRRLWIGLAHLGVLVCLLSLWGCSASLYLSKLGWGQARIIRDSKPIANILNDSSVDDSLRAKIGLVVEAKTYAEERIGLERTSNFSTFYRVEGSALLYVVSAAYKDRLEPYTWWFPITGRVTAKGFFSREDALREKEKLSEKGFDVFVQGAQAYSTLGWFDDPIFSTMLDGSAAMVVYGVIHELTHATVFFKGQLDFNEQIATFVGGQGAVDFTGEKFGQGSFLQSQAIGFVEDGVLFAAFINDLSRGLDRLYARPLSSEEKQRRRTSIFDRAEEDFQALKKSLKTRFYLGFEKLELNNAVILALGRYVANIGEIQHVYERLGRDLQKTVEFLKEMKDAAVENPEQYIATWLRNTDTEVPSFKAEAGSE